MNPRQELVGIIAELTLISHVPAVNLNPQPPATDDAVGGRRPPGGIEREDDRTDGFDLKSADHFTRRLERARSDRAVELILIDARRALRAWRRTPVTGRPLPGTPFFRRWILDELERGTPASDVARLGGCSAQYVRKVRSEG